MGDAPWSFLFPRWRYLWRWKTWKRFIPWLLLLSSFGFIRLSKGAAFLDFYAFVTRPFWPGPAQRDWLQSGFLIEQNAKLILLEKDNQRLRRLLAIEQKSEKTRKSAAVISRSSRGWWHKLELSKGRIHGIKEGNAVLGPGGLLGRIHSVTPTTSRVLLLTAPSSKIGVWVPRTESHGLLIGMGTSRPQLRFIDKDPNVIPGDLISTSPASTLLPPNVPVGVVQFLDIRAQPSPNAAVQLIASPEAIDWVQVQIR